MADALCGPSNALQNFQKHSTADRTLQQDRLISRNSPSQGFRSSPGPSAGLLDPEFEAFQTGQTPLQYPEAQQFHPAGPQNSYAPQQIYQPSPAAWASDFQNLNIAGPLPQFQQRSYAQQPGNGWQAEFAKQQSQPVGEAPSSYVGYNSLPFQRLSTIAPMVPLQAPSYSMPSNQGQIEQSQAQNTEAFDEEAFARAFDQAAQAELALDQAEQQSIRAGQDVMVNESAERLLGLEQELEPARLGADLIHDPREGESNQQQEQQDDPDALARTAGQLLDSVKDNQSDKFQKSQFLELMRQLRDREVMVEGDKIVGVQSEDKTNSGMGSAREELEKSLLSIARQLSLLDFARIESLLGPNPPLHLISSSPTSKNQPWLLPLHSQLLFGNFVRTLTHISAALDVLEARDPELLQRTLPFGMSIGVEVFALADSTGRMATILDGLPLLKELVLRFKKRFEEVDIGAGMVRRLSGKGGLQDGMQRREEGRDDSSEDERAGETWLTSWLSNWLETVPSRRQHRNNIFSPTNMWLFSPSQLHDLLGPDIYPLPKQGQQPHQPTTAALSSISAILGPGILQTMVNLWRSPHMSLFVNPPISDMEQFEDYFNDIAGLQESIELFSNSFVEERNVKALFPTRQQYGEQLERRHGPVNMILGEEEMPSDEELHEMTRQFDVLLKNQRLETGVGH